MLAGGAAGGFCAGITGLVRYAVAAPGIVTLPTYMGEDPMNIWKAVGTLAIAFVVTFVLTPVSYTDLNAAIWSKPAEKNVSGVL